MHADITDQAAELEELERTIALANRKKPTMVFTGECHWCEEQIGTGHYCDKDCRHDHEVFLWAEQQRRIA
ncbi:hypothetical protein MZUP3_330 [Erwinia phage vB_EhrS_49]|uniref:Uncharacterized protein n=1 Tax=Erwinia phage vB_EhrS_49 TaxID=2283026 RepID=A0A4Y1NR25_9CAUD|nr:DksA-like zinc-finger protein [Erwinia phage vB_EhrS_49]AXH43452.1 hypothetical protein MZUP3_330 [Erwinia phage vB_EhrS_49]